MSCVKGSLRQGVPQGAPKCQPFRSGTCLRPPSRRLVLVQAEKVHSETAADASPEVAAAAKELVKLAVERADQGTLDKQIALLERLSKAAGTNQVVPSLNDGAFASFSLSGRIQKITSNVMTIGALSFNAYQPTSLRIKTTNRDNDGFVFKGPREGVANAYVVATPFEVMEDGDDTKGTGILGRSLAIGEYKAVADNPSRQSIKFTRLQLEPATGTPQNLQRWLDILKPHNPTMNPETGILQIPLPAKSPEGFLDILLMTSEFQLVKGNAGSITLLQRKE